MKSIKSFVLFFVSLFCFACGEQAPSSEALAEQSQAAVWDYTVTNGTGTMPAFATRFCRATKFDSLLGHAASPDWPNGVAKSGSTFLAFPGQFVATPHGGYGGGEYARTDARCEPYTNYVITSATQSSDSNPYGLYWGESSGGNHVEQTIDLWGYPNTFCFISGVASFSAGDDPDITEFARIDPVGATWKLTVGGTPTIGAWAKCINPNKVFNILRPYVAGTGQKTQGPATWRTFCGFTLLQGNLDDAKVAIYAEAGHWWLEVTSYDENTAPYAEMACAQFP